MTRGHYLAGLLTLAVILVGIRLILPPLGVPGPFYGRLEAISFAILIAVAGVTAFAMLRMWNAWMHLAWGLPVFLWTAASEPIIRTLVGGDFESSSLPGAVGTWWEIPTMLAILLAFLAMFERRTATGVPELVAAGVAGLATRRRPSLIVSSLDRLPLIGEPISLSGDTLTFFLRLEHAFGAAKGLFFLPEWFGGAVLVVVFTTALAGMVSTERRRAPA